MLQTVKVLADKENNQSNSKIESTDELSSSKDAVEEFDKDSFYKLKNNVDNIQKDLFGLQGIKKFVKEPAIGEINNYLSFSVKHTQSVLDKFSI